MRRSDRRSGPAVRGGEPSAARPVDLDAAVVAHRAGRLADAEAAYRDILARAPRHADALQLLGVLLQQQGRGDEAVASIRAAIAIEPAAFAYHFNLGNALKAQGKLDEAAAAFRRTIALNRDYADAHYNLGNTLRALGRPGEAVAAYEWALSLKPDYVAALVNLAATLKSLGQNDAALAALRDAEALAPDNANVRHMLAALTGAPAQSAPREFVARLFDEYAKGFEAHLTQGLAYRTPGLLRELVAEAAGADRRFRAMIDLGAGTGLCGAEFRGAVGRLVGVDLSAGMVAEARRKAIYDDLVVGDVVEALAADDRYDLFLAADVFVYMGDLAPMFAAVRARALAPAWFAFSTEHADEGGFILRRTGRFAHAPAYVKGLAEQHGFRLLATRGADLRKEAASWIRGDLYVLGCDG